MIEFEELNAQQALDNSQVNNKTLEQQLADANKEIADLKSQIMWLNRSFE